MLGATHRRAARRGPAAGRPATAATCRPTRRSRSRRRCCRSTGSARPTAPGVDSLLGPEMKSTGEVMGIDADFGTRVRQVARPRRTARCRPRARCSSRWPTATSARMIFPVKRLADLGLRDRWPPRAPPRCCGATASPCERRAQALRGPARRRRRGRRADPRRRGRPGDQHPVRQLRRRASTATRSARPRWRRTSRASPPCRAPPRRCRASRR